MGGWRGERIYKGICESHSDSYYYGVGKNLCAGISIRNMNRQIYRRSKAEEGHTYVENINNTGSWRQRVSIADGYWARGNWSLDVWNDEDVQHYSDSHFIKEFTNYGHLYTIYKEKS